MVGHLPLHARSDHERRYPHPIGGVRRTVVHRWRVDVVVEATVLVVTDDQQRVIPILGLRECVVELQNELLAGEDVRWRVVVV
jgi:hypothetical protein